MEVADPSDREDRVNDAIAEFLTALESDRPAQADEWLGRHPDLRDELVSFLADRALVEELTRPFRPPLDHTQSTIGYSTLPEEDTLSGGPRRLGDYELQGEIARGGMGVVYRARHVRLGRLVAIKTILAGQLAAPEEVERFRTEAEAAAALEHPHVVPIYEVGEEAGVHYFAMRLIEGRSLAQMLRDGPVAPQAAGWLISVVARAVHHAHERGVLHRDLKPANILLDADGFPHVADFGLAKRFDGVGSLSQSGFVGTVEYLAPEQAAGRSARLTPASDVYSLGVILYELLTGRTPFRGETLLAVLRQAQEQEPLSPRVLEPRIDRDLETVCLKCLEKDARRRYSSAAALADDIDRWLGQRPIRARPSGACERGLKWVRRHPARAGLAVAALAVVGLLLAYLGVRIDLAEADRRASEERAELLVRERRLLEADQALRNAMSDLEKGEIGPGLLWLARGLETLPEGEAEFERSFRLLLGSWSQQAHPLRQMIAAPPVMAAMVALSPDGRLLARGGSRAVSCDPKAPSPRCNTIELYDLFAGRRLGEPITFPADVSTIDFSPDSKLLGVELKAGAARYLDIATRRPAPAWKEQRRWEPAGALGRALAWSADGRRCLVASKEADRVQLYEGGKAIHLAVLPGFRPEMGAVHPDGKHIALGTGPWSEAKQVGLYDVTTGRRRGNLLMHAEAVVLVRFVADGKHLLTGCDAGYLHLWNVETGRRVAEPFRFRHDGSALAYNLRESVEGRGNHLLYINSETGMGQLLDLLTGEPHGERLRPGPGGLEGWDWLPDGRHMLCCGSIDIRLCAIATPPRGAVIPPGQASPPDTRYEVRLAFDHAGDARAGKPVTLAHPGGRLELRLDGARARLVARGTQESGAVFHHSAAIQTAAFSPDGSKLVTAWSGQVQCWDVHGGIVSGPWKMPGPVHSLCFSPDSTTVALVHDVPDDWSAHARLWNPTADQAPPQAFARLYPATICTFSPDGSRLLGQASRDSVRLWDARTGKPLGAPLELGAQVDACGFSPDGGMVVASGLARARDPRYPDPSPMGRIRLWDARTRCPLGPPVNVENGGNTRAWFSADGRWLYSRWSDTRRWPAPAPVPGEPDRLRLWVEVITGLTLDSGGAVVPLDVAGWQERRRQLDARGGPPS